MAASNVMDFISSVREAPQGIRRATSPQNWRKTVNKSADALGWFSIGLGITEMLAPRALSKLIGIPPRTGVMRLMGLREVAVGVGILNSRDRAGWLWARVAGDVLDMAAMAKSAESPQACGALVSASMGVVGAVTMIDIMCAKELSAQSDSGTRLSASIVTNQSPDQCYRYWRDIENFPRFQTYVKSVRVTGDRRSHWIASGPGDVEFEWDAEITADEPGEQIAWQTLEGAEVPHSGSVRFEPVRGRQGTIVRLRMQPLGTGGSLLAKVLGRDPGSTLRKALLRFKQLLETGEIATTEGQPSGRRTDVTRLDRMARI